MNNAISDRDIVEFFSSGIIATDSHAISTHLNRHSEKKLKVTASELVGKNISDVLPAFHSAIMECLRSGKPVINLLQEVVQGQWVIHGNPIWNGQHLVGAVLNFHETDIFEASAKKSKSYKELNRQLETIIGSSSDGIWVCDAKGFVITINSASEKLNGIKAKEVIGKNITELLDNKNFDQLVTTKVLASGKQETIVQEIKKTTESFYVQEPLRGTIMAILRSSLSMNET